MIDINGWKNRLQNSIYSTDILKKLAVHPCVINGNKTFVYEKGLPDISPDLYRQLNEFAKANGFNLKEDQRGGFKKVSRERRAGLMPILVLGTSLLTQNSLAVMDNFSSPIDEPVTTPIAAVEDNSIELIEGFSSEGELMEGLLGWINHHSSFSYSKKELPEIKHVSQAEMLTVAFGKEMPKAIDQKTLQIFGLFNFEEKAVYLFDSIDLHTVKGKAILLRELVHFLQYQYGHDRDVSCKNELESLAYLLEARYLISEDNSPTFSQHDIRHVSTCH